MITYPPAWTLLLILALFGGQIGWLLVGNWINSRRLTALERKAPK